MIRGTANIIAENFRRLEVINTPYNPLVGTQYCEEIQRVHIHIDDAPIPDMWIPVEMCGERVVLVLEKAKTLADAGRAIFGGAATKTKSQKVWKQFLKARCKHDFEFWCVTQIVIRQKGKGQRDYFILNRAQRFYLRHLERLRKAGVAIEIILLKARQWGGSTMTQFYMFWIQKMWRKEWNSVICGAVEKQAKIVLSMLEKAAVDYDPLIDDGVRTKIKPFGRMANVRELIGRGCTISVGSAERPDNIRSEDISMAHITEIGVWPSTESKTPEDPLQSIMGTYQSGPYSLYVLESTAKGVGNYFHNTWKDAEAGKNNLTPVFVPWFYIDTDSKEIEDYETFVGQMDDNELYLFDLGATLEAINWYRYKLKSMGGDRARMCSENPSTALEAFQSTGSLYFPNEYTNRLYADCEDPSFVGDIFGNGEKGNAAMEGLHLDRVSNGNFKVWVDVDTVTHMRNRYLVCVDLGKGHSATADNSVITVFDRYWQTEYTGVPEVVAEWAGHLDMDLVAWKAAQIAKYYNSALLVIEDNSLVMSGIEYFMTVLAEIKDYYPNIWKRTRANKTEKAGTAQYGWRTDGESKPRILTNLKSALRQQMYIERCREAVDEMKIYEEKENGKFGNVEGKNNHDDRVITRAIGVTFMFDRNLMDPPTLYDPKTEKTSYSKEIVNEYS